MEDPSAAASADGGAPANMSQMNANLTAAKEGRKRAELDAQLLANRIALLKQEEEKAWKKIEETRKRANEVMEVRRTNEQKFKDKEDMYKKKWHDIREAQANISYNRDKSKAVRDGVRAGMLEQRQGNRTQTKMQSQQYLLAKKEREATERQENANRSAFIKTRKEEAKRRLEEERLAQLEKYREDYESRVSQEEMLRARTDALVAKMEKEEMELIQRLQNTQTVQKNAYDELEAALGATQTSLAGPKGGGRSSPEAGSMMLAPRPAA